MTDGKSEEFLRRTGAAGRREQWSDPMGPDFNLNYTRVLVFRWGKWQVRNFTVVCWSIQQPDDIRSVCFILQASQKDSEKDRSRRPVPGS